MIGAILLVSSGAMPWWPSSSPFIGKMFGRGILSVAEAEGAERTTDLSQIPGTRVSLLKPIGFTTAENFPGYQNKSAGASVMVTEIPGPYSEVTKGFTTGRMKARGMTLRSKEEIAVDGREGLLMSVTQRAYGRTFAKWISVIGDEEETVMITATFLKDRESDFSSSLRHVVLNVRWDKSKQVDPFSDLRFTILETDRMEYVKRLGKTLLYSRDGLFPATSPEHPIFVVG
jgi:hypothetical protein